MNNPLYEEVVQARVFGTSMKSTHLRQTSAPPNQKAGSGPLAATGPNPKRLDASIKRIGWDKNNMFWAPCKSVVVKDSSSSSPTLES